LNQLIFCIRIGYGFSFFISREHLVEDSKDNPEYMVRVPTETEARSINIRLVRVKTEQKNIFSVILYFWFILDF